MSGRKVLVSSLGVNLRLRLRGGNWNGILEVVRRSRVGCALGVTRDGVFGGWFHVSGAGEAGFGDPGRTTELASGIGYRALVTGGLGPCCARESSAGLFEVEGRNRGRNRDSDRGRGRGVA